MSCNSRLISVTKDVAHSHHKSTHPEEVTHLFYYFCLKNFISLRIPIRQRSYDPHISAFETVAICVASMWCWYSGQVFSILHTKYEGITVILKMDPKLLSCPIGRLRIALTPILLISEQVYPGATAKNHGSIKQYFEGAQLNLRDCSLKK